MTEEAKNMFLKERLSAPPFSRQGCFRPQIVSMQRLIHLFHRCLPQFPCRPGPCSLCWGLGSGPSSHWADVLRGQMVATQQINIGSFCDKMSHGKIPWPRWGILHKAGLAHGHADPRWTIGVPSYKQPDPDMMEQWRDRQQSHQFQGTMSTSEHCQCLINTFNTSRYS